MLPCLHDRASPESIRLYPHVSLWRARSPSALRLPRISGRLGYHRAPHRSRDASATPVRIDRCLQSTLILFSKMGHYPFVSAHSAPTSRVGSGVVASRRPTRFGGLGERWPEALSSSSAPLLPSVPLTLRRCAGCQRIAPSPFRRRETRRPSVSARVVRTSEDMRKSGRPRQPRSTRYRWT